MGWLIGYTLASIAAAFIVVRLFDYIFAGVTGSLVNIARFGLFVATWSAVTVKAVMHGFTGQVRQLRQSNAAAIEAITKSGNSKG